MKLKLLAILGLAFLISCGDKSKEPAKDDSKEIQAQAQSFLDSYYPTYQELYYNMAEAEWKQNTYILEGDTATEKMVKEAGKAFSNFTGSKTNIDSAKYYLNISDKLTEKQVREFEAMLYAAGGNPETAGDIVDSLIAANNAQVATPKQLAT